MFAQTIFVFVLYSIVVALPSEDVFYGIKMREISRNPIDFAKFKNRVVLVSNIASQCGYTEKGYSDLNSLYTDYHESGLDILGVPCNQFGGQEPGSDIEIDLFAKRKGAKFTITEKADVNGYKTHDLFRFLKGEHLPVEDLQRLNHKGNLHWNFEYFLVDKNGRVVERWKTGTDMTSKEVRTRIWEELKRSDKTEL